MSSGPQRDRDRVWRVARWVVAVPAFLCSVAVLVVGCFALYYAKKASNENVRASVVGTYARVSAQVSETDALLRQARQAITRAQEDAASAKKQLAAIEARLEVKLTKAQATADQTNKLLAENAQEKQQLATDLAAISKQLAAIDDALKTTAP